jgi:hypothetical protein
VTPVVVPNPSWRDWFKLTFQWRFWRPVWEVQVFDAESNLMWYSTQMHGLRAVIVAEGMCSGHLIVPSHTVQVIDVKTGRVGWVGWVENERKKADAKG